MKLFREIIALPALLLLTAAGSEAFSFFGGGRASTAGLMPRTRRPSSSSSSSSFQYYYYADHAGRMAVRMAAEAKNASEISHENVVEYREKLSMISRANGEDSDVSTYTIRV